MCSTCVADAQPLVILRAISLVDLRNCGFRDDPDDVCAQAEYHLLTKNSELLASWACVGELSGVRRFNSGERAFSSQTSPGRFVRLGLTVAVLSAATAAVMSACEAATGAEALTTAAASTAGAGAASVGAAAANVEQSTITMVQDGLAANTVSMASAETVASSPSGF